MVGQKGNSRIHQVPKEAIAVAVLAIFPFIVLALIFLLLKRSPSEYHLMGSDEMDYWIESATVMRRGLFNPNTGFFGYSWQTHAKLMNFGGHGLFSIIPFSILGFFTTWRQSSVMLVNAALISASIVFAYLTSRLIWKTIFTVCILFLFTSFSLYFLSGMLEGLMFSGSLMLAVLLPKLISDNGFNNNAYGWFLGLSIAWSLFRLGNIVFLFPLIILEIVKYKRIWWKVLLKYGLIGLIIVLASILFTAPYPWGFISRLSASEEKLMFFTTHFFENLKLFFRFDQARKIEATFRIGYLAWILFLGANLIHPRGKPKNQKLRCFCMLQLIILSSVLLLHLCFYDVGELRDLRILSPILFFTFASTVFFSSDTFRKKFLIIFICSLLTVSTAINLVQIRTLKADFIDPYFDDKRVTDLFTYIKYDPQATDRWQNTVYLDVFNYVWMDFKQYDPGIGLMLPVGGDFELLNMDEVRSTLKAKYLITYRYSSLPFYELIASDDNVYLLKRIQD